MSDQDDYNAGRYGGVFSGNDHFAYQQGMNDRVRWEEASARMDQQGASGFNWSSMDHGGPASSSGPAHHEAFMGSSAANQARRAEEAERERAWRAEGLASMFRDHSPARGKDREHTEELELMEVYHGGMHVLHLHGKQLGLQLAAGMPDGHRIRLKGRGDLSKNGGENGDLLITFRIKPHVRFQRVGNDLHTTVLLSKRILSFGGDVLVPSPGDGIKVSVEPGVHGRPQMRVPQRGFPVYGSPGAFGDLVVEFVGEG